MRLSNFNEPKENMTASDTYSKNIPSGAKYEEKADLFLYPEEFKDLYQNVCVLDAINIFSEFIEFPFLLTRIIQDSFIVMQEYVNVKI
jgi:hypothetical protein